MITFFPCKINNQNQFITTLSLSPSPIFEQYFFLAVESQAPTPLINWFPHRQILGLLTITILFLSSFLNSSAYIIWVLIFLAQEPQCFLNWALFFSSSPSQDFLLVISITREIIKRVLKNLWKSWAFCFCFFFFLLFINHRKIGSLGWIVRGCFWIICGCWFLFISWLEILILVDDQELKGILKWEKEHFIRVDQVLVFLLKV